MYILKETIICTCIVHNVYFEGNSLILHETPVDRVKKQAKCLKNTAAYAAVNGVAH